MSDHGGIEKGSGVSARQGRGTFCRLISLFLLATLTSGALGADGVEAEPFHVLVLHSYHQGFAWTDETQVGLEQGFAEAGLVVEWSVEYMDAKRHPGQELSPELAKLFAEKYADWRPDVIISCDDDALQFLVAYRERLFPGVPVVFCGLNVADYDPQTLAGMAGYTGVIKRLDYNSTVDLILELHPDVKRLICVHDRTTQGLGDRQTLEKMADAYTGRLEFVFPDTGKGLSEGELLDYLRNAPDDSAGLFVGFFRDRLGEALEMRHIIRSICTASRVPIYTVADAYLGEGTVGGKLLRGEKMGRTTAGMAARLLRGEPVSQVPVAIRPLNEYMFDYRQLQRFEIPESRLPAGSIVLYGPTGFYEQHRVAILWGVAGVVLLCVFTGMLLAYTVWRRRVERQLAASEAKYRLLAEHATDMLSKHDAEGRYTYVSPSCVRLLGYAEDELLGHDAFEFMHPDDIEHCKQVLAGLHAGKEDQTAEHRLIGKDGQAVWVETTTRVVWDDATGQIDEIVAITRNILPRRRAEQRLRESEVRFRHLYQAVQAGVVVIDREGNITDTNDAAGEILEMDAGGITACSVSDDVWQMVDEDGLGVPGEEHPSMITLRTGEPVRNAVRGVYAGDPDRMRWLLINTEPIFELSGSNVQEVIVTFLDITAVKQNEEELRRSNADLRLAQEIAGIGNWSLDPAVGVSEWSDEVYRIYDRDPALGPLSLEEYPKIYTGRWWPRFNDRIRAAVRDGTPYDIELRLELPSGEVKWVHSICHPEPEPGPKGHVLHGTIQDITQSKRIAEQLRESKQMLADAERLTRVGGWVWHVQEDRWEFSENWLAIHGCVQIPTTSEELLLVAHPDDRQWVREIFAGIMAGETDYNIELRIVRQDTGEMRYIHAQGEAELDEDGKVVRLVGAGADVTELKRTTDALKASQQMLADAERLARVGGFVWHVQEDRWEVSENWLAIHGCTKPPQTSEELMPIAHPDDRARIEQAFEAMMSGQACYDLEHRIIRQDTGEVRYIHARGEAEFDEDGKVVRVVGAGVDVTDLKRMTDSLKASQQMLTDSERLAKVGGWVWHVQEDRWEVSKNWLAIHGCDEAPASAEDLLTLFHPDDLDACKTMLEDVQVRRQPGDLEFRIVRRDTGEVRHIHAVGESHFDENDRIDYVCGASMDVTELKRAQAQRDALEAKLLEAQKLQAVGRLAGGVAHDFNNKLQTILGYANLLLIDLPANSAYREDLEMIRDAAAQSADLTKQLLAFAQRQTAVARPLDLNDFIAEKWTMLESIAGERIAMSWQPGMGIGQIKADPAQIEQILVNLITNAREAIDTVGHITLATAPVPAADVPTPNGEDAAIHAEAYVCLRVSDDGRGMEEETLEQVFEPFYSTKDRAKGAGLGLATVYGIVTQNKGYVDVESCPHRGTTFRIFLPASLAPKTREPVLVDEPVEAYEAMGAVLLVEDEASILRLCRKVVDGLGYETLAASSPEEALAIISDPGQVVDLLISDVVMPNMTGTQLRKAIEAKTGPLPCIFMSGYVQDTPEALADKEGTYFIAKPFSLPQLQQLVREVMSSHRRKPEVWRSDDTDTAYE